MKSMTNKKKRLLLSLAMVCVGWGEGADFEFKEVILDGGYYKDVMTVYGIEYPDNDDYPDGEEDAKFKADFEKWEKGLVKIQEEVVEFLTSLHKNYK